MCLDLRQENNCFAWNQGRGEGWREETKVTRKWYVHKNAIQYAAITNYVGRSNIQYFLYTVTVIYQDEFQMFAYFLSCWSAERICVEL